MVTETITGNRCRACGSTLLDPLNSDDRDAVAGVMGLRAMRTANASLLGLTFLVATALGMATVYGDEDVLNLVMLGSIAAFAALVWGRRLRDRQWEIPTGEAHPIRNRLTSTTTISLIACVVMYIVESRIGAEAVDYAAGDPWWRIATSALAHGSLFHLGGNMVALLVFGLPIDRRIGRLWTGVVLTAAAFAGALAQARYSHESMVGFSGAIYGLFGATLVLMPNRPRLFSINGVMLALPTWAWMAVTVPTYAILSALDPSQHIAWVAHLGGFVAGIVVALPMRRIAPSPAFVLAEQRRATQVAHLAAHSDAAGVVDVGDLGNDRTGDSEDRTGVTSPEVRAFLASGRRRKIVVTAIGASLFLSIGVTAAALGIWLQAPAAAAGKRVDVLICGLIMAVAGMTMIAQLFQRAPRRA